MNEQLKEKAMPRTTKKATTTPKVQPTTSIEFGGSKFLVEHLGDQVQALVEQLDTLRVDEYNLTRQLLVTQAQMRGIQQALSEVMGELIQRAQAKKQADAQAQAQAQADEPNTY